jgi:DNA-binding response OmpR family regulator
VTALLLSSPPPQCDETLSSEVVNLGGWDVLAKPLDPVEVTRVISSALRWRASERREGVQKRGAAWAGS